MNLPAFQRVFPNDYDMASVEHNVDRAMRPVLSCSLLNGQLLQGVALVSGQTNYVNHGLGRTLLGWLLVDNSADCRVWRATAQLSSQLALLTSGTTTVSLWVF